MSSLREIVAPAGLGPGDHAAWAVDGEEAERVTVARWTQEGVARGEKVLVVGARGVTSSADVEQRLPEDVSFGRTQVEVRDLDETYELVRLGRLHEQADLFRQEASRALADGYTGLRVWADVTPLTADERGRELYLDYESVVEQVFRDRPVTGVCALDVGAGSELWDLVASRHRVRGVSARGRFPLAVTVYDGVVHVVGEARFGALDELRGALLSAGRSTEGALVLDLEELRFLDVAGARAVAAFVADQRRRGRVVTVVNAAPMAARILEVFGVAGDGR